MRNETRGGMRGKTRRKVLMGAVAGIVAIVAILVSPLGTPIVSAVQNIFGSLGAVKDITYGGKNVNKVVYRGEVIWERIPSIMQAVTTANCPTDRTKVNDARDNTPYWIQKLPDGRCWMLTNLAYAGGGRNTYGDVKTITRYSGTGLMGGDADTAYAVPQYVDLAARGYGTDTLNITNPASNTTFYGHLYNWCAAMGGQTSACNGTSTSGFNTSVSICPRGWRLPTGGTATATSDFGKLVAAVGAINNSTGSSKLRNSWLAVYSGYYSTTTYDQGSSGAYVSSTVNNATNMYYLSFTSAEVLAGTNSSRGKGAGLAVRCVAE